MKQVFMRKNPLRRASIVIEEVPSPRCGPAEVLIANGHSLISAGTEIASIRRNVKDMVVKAVTDPDLRESVKEMLLKDGLRKTVDRVQYETSKWTPMGYSGAGIAVAVGDQVEGIKQGDLVAYAGEGHAEILCVGRNLCVRVPDGVDSRQAAFVALGSIALQAVRRAEVQVGDIVAVLGLGLVGQLVSQLLLAAGARVLGADVLPQRLELARSLGLEHAFAAGDGLAKEVLRYTQGVGVDRVMICASSSGSQVVEQAVAMARDRARLVVVGMVGLEVPCEEFYRKELDLVISRSYGPGRYDAAYEEHGIDYPLGYVRWTEHRNMEEFLRLVQAGKVQLSPLITHEFTIDKAADGYDLLHQRGGECLAVLLQYPGSAEAVATRQISLAVAKVVPRDGNRANVIVAGCGAFARQFHLPNLRASTQMQLWNLVASSGQSAKEMATRYGARQCTTDYRAALADPEADAVLVLTRDHSHAGQVVAALEAGKHVFCEKPLATTLEDCRRIAEAQRGAQRVCMVGFNRRFAHLAREARAVIQECSGPRTIHYRANAGPLPTDHWVYDPVYAAGRIVGEACHFVDFCCWLIGAEPTSVYAQATGESRSLSRLEDVTATFRFADGSVASLLYTARGSTRYGKERVEVFADGSTVVLEDFRHLCVRGRQRLDRRNRRADKGHAEELAHFGRAILGLESPLVTHRDGIRANLCCLAIFESVQGGEPVAIEAGWLD